MMVYVITAVVAVLLITVILTVAITATGTRIDVTGIRSVPEFTTLDLAADASSRAVVVAAPMT